MTKNEEKKIEDLRADRDAACLAMGVALEARKQAAAEYTKARKRYGRALEDYLKYREEVEP